MRGRSITNDSAVLSLFQSINNMHPQLLELLNQLDERRRTWGLPGRDGHPGGSRWLLGLPQPRCLGACDSLSREKPVRCAGGV